MKRIWQWILKEIFFSNVSGVIKHGTTHFLEIQDMPSFPKHLQPNIEQTLSNNLNLSSLKQFILSLLIPHKRRFLIATALIILTIISSLLTPFIVFKMLRILELVSSAQSGIALGFFAAFCLVVFSLASQLLMQHFFYRALQLNQILVNDINVLVFHKALHMSYFDKSRTQTGDVVNHLGTDTDMVSEIPMMLLNFIHTISMAIGGVALLLYIAGSSAIIGIVLIVLIVPMTQFIAPKIAVLDHKLMALIDTRITLLSQVLRGIRVIKYFCWEHGMLKHLQFIRSNEISIRYKLTLVHGIASLAYTVLPVLVLLSIFAVKIYKGEVLDAAIAFSCISTLAILHEPLGNLAYQITHFIQARVSAERLMKFLSALHLNKSTENKADNLENTGIEISNLSANYLSNKLILKNLSLHIKAGESVAIVGPVGSGKTTFLHALLQEIPILSGNIVFTSNNIAINNYTPQIAYTPQEAFIQNDSIKNNILLGRQAQPTEILNAIRYACLDTDILSMPANIETEIGEHGVNLSGGQKQRLCLARAALGKQNIVILDDPFAAVDPDTETNLINKLIFGHWKGTTRIITTHRLSHLPRFDKIVFLCNGEIIATGCYNEIYSNCIEFRDFLNIANNSDHDKNIAEPLHARTEISENGLNTGQLTEAEDRERGSVRKKVFFEYIKALGGDNPKTRGWILTFAALTITLVVAVPMLQESWVAIWLNKKTPENGFGIFSVFANYHITPTIGIATYAILGVIIVIAIMINSMYIAFRGIIAGQIIHDKALASVLFANIRFFDSTPVGRIYNRFSRDGMNIDSELIWAFMGFIFCIYRLLIILFFAVLALPILIIALIPMLILYYRAQHKYRACAREAKRLHSITRSPRYSHFKETLDGLVVMRAFKQESFFVSDFLKHLSLNQHMFHSSIIMNRWFSVRMPMLSGILFITSAFSVVVLSANDSISSGTTGLLLSLILNSTGMLNWAVRSFSDLESQMTSVERLKTLSETPHEKNITTTPCLSSTTPWPTEGTIEFINVNARYAPQLPLVLKQISFTIPGGSRVGIIGKTGSGKTTLFQTIFRFIEIDSGIINIDNTNIAGIPLPVLRKAIAIVPQDPILFIGTLRKNLDFFDNYTDAQLEASLKRVQLWDFVSSLPEKLNAAILENGSNLSLGQRQLICLARALLEKAKIIVLDEATASVDVQTDIQIQRVLREECIDITVLVIAHRIDTVSDFPMLIELSDGHIKNISHKNC